MSFDPAHGGLAYSLRRYFVDEFCERQVSALAPYSRLLDVGGHKGPARGQFCLGRFPLKVVAVNLTRRYPPDVQGNAADLPLRGATFEAVLCSEVLEHVPDPRPVLREAHRVLVPGGRLIICVPFLHQIHPDPLDYGRYTDAYWSEQLTHAAFQVACIERQGQYWSVLVDMVRAYCSYRLATARLTERRFHRFCSSRLVAWAKRRAVVWDRAAGGASNGFSKSFTTGFGIVAVKLS